jgi:predicted DNA-binding transcriptional regulator AlpA
MEHPVVTSVMADDDEIKTSNEVADRLKIKPKTLSEWRSAGKGPKFFRVGRTIRYRESEIRSWLESQSKDVE